MALDEARHAEERRKALGLSPHDLGRIAGVTHQTVRNFELGRKVFGPTRQAILVALDKCEREGVPTETPTGLEYLEKWRTQLRAEVMAEVEERERRFEARIVEFLRQSGLPLDRFPPAMTQQPDLPANVKALPRRDAPPSRVVGRAAKSANGDRAPAAPARKRPRPSPPAEQDDV